MNARQIKAQIALCRARISRSAAVVEASEALRRSFPTGKPREHADNGRPGTRVAVVTSESPKTGDDLGKRGGQVRERIDVNQDSELRDWAKKFGVSPEELKRAVQQVGDRADAVRHHLGK